MQCIEELYEKHLYEEAIDEKYQISDEFWELIKPIIPTKEKKKSGRPREDDRKILTAILYILKTGCQWSALPKSLGAKSTVHDRLQEWEEAGFFHKLWEKGLTKYNFMKGINWAWQSMDGSIVQAQLGGDKTGPSYKHRGKNGTNRSVLTDEKGIPLSIVIERANCNDMKLVNPTIEAIILSHPETIVQNICMDKGYDYPEVDIALSQWGYISHIRRKGEEVISKEELPSYYKAKRWVVERTHAWINKFRRLIIRWEKKSQNYLAFIHFACAIICYRSTKSFNLYKS
jgi:putative transposase